MNQTTTFYLMRHALSLPQEGVDNASWPLASDGQEAAQKLVPILSALKPDGIVSSPYRRAMMSVQPAADALGLSVMGMEELHDQIIAAETLAPSEFQELSQLMWDNPHHAEFGMENNSACQQRMLVAMRHIAEKFSGQTVVVCSHSGPISQFLKALDAGFTFQDWANMPMPALYKVYYNGDTFRWDSQIDLTLSA